MENALFLLVLIPLALIALPIIALVTSNSRARELRAEMADLLGRIRFLETRLENLAQRPAVPDEAPPREPVQASQASAPAVAPATRQSDSEAPQGPPSLPHPAPALPAAPPAVPFAAPQFRTFEAASAGDSRSLESRIGSQWFNRIGILAVLIGVAWFLKLAFDNHWIGALGRVLIGLLAGAGLMAWSERFHRRGFAVFSYS